VSQIGLLLGMFMGAVCHSPSILMLECSLLGKLCKVQT
jgi:hypothetical protein